MDLPVIDIESAWRTPAGTAEASTAIVTPVGRRLTYPFSEGPPPTPSPQNQIVRTTSLVDCETQLRASGRGESPRRRTLNCSTDSPIEEVNSTFAFQLQGFQRQTFLQHGILCRSSVGRLPRDEKLAHATSSRDESVESPKVVMKEVVLPQVLISRQVRKVNEILATAKTCLKLLLSCWHSCLAPTLGIMFQADRITLCCQYIPSGNVTPLAEKLNQDALKKGLAEIGSALRYLNSRRLPHRHLTLENILLGEQGYMLSDSGLGSLFLGTTANDVYAMGYRASSMFPPETIGANIDPNAINAEKCDVWAFGCVAYQLAFGCEPFNGRTKDELFESIKKGNPEYLHDGNSKFSKEFIDYLSLCMTPDPKGRPQFIALLRHRFIKKASNYLLEVDSFPSTSKGDRRNSTPTAGLNLSICELVMADSAEFGFASISVTPTSNVSREVVLHSSRTSLAQTPVVSSQHFSIFAGIQRISNPVFCTNCRADVRTKSNNFHACGECDYILCAACMTSDVGHDPTHVLRAFVIEEVSSDRYTRFLEQKKSAEWKMSRQPSFTSHGSLHPLAAAKQLSSFFEGASPVAPPSVPSSQRSSSQRSGSSQQESLRQTRAPFELTPKFPPLGQTMFFIIPMDLLTDEEKTRFHVSGHLPMGRLRSLRTSRRESLTVSPTCSVDPSGLIDLCIAQQSQELDLHRTNLDVVPSVLFQGKLFHITSLDLSENSLTELPDGIGFLSNLQELRVSSNKLKSLPDGIGDLQSLERLDANRNVLQELPQTFMFLESLTTLSLDYNHFKCIPEVIFDMVNLQTLYLAANYDISHWPSLDLFSNVTSLQIGLDNEPSVFREYGKISAQLKGVTVMWNKIYPDEVIPGLFNGSLRSAQTPHVYERLNITHILTAGRDLEALVVPGMRQKIIQLDDLENASMKHMLDPSFEFIDEALKSGGGCLVHCFAGMSRSASACIAYLMRRKSMRLDDAYNHMKKARPAIYPNKGFFEQLLAYDKELFPDGRPLDIASMHREIVP